VPVVVVALVAAFRRVVLSWTSESWFLVGGITLSNELRAEVVELQTVFTNIVSVRMLVGGKGEKRTSGHDRA
jgi:hypothetical protein